MYYLPYHVTLWRIISLFLTFLITLLHDVSIFLVAISLRVEPPQPPPYELHPPPYCTLEKETSSKKREILTFSTDEPPAYSQHEGRS